MNKIRRAFLGRAALLLSFLVFSAVLSLLLLTPVFAAESEERFELDADKLIYDNAAETATAEGNVRLSGNDLQMLAPQAVYDVRAGIVTAHSGEGGKITLIAGGATLTGQSVEYNVNSREGFLTQPTGRMDAVFFKGGDVVVMPAGEALRRKLVSKGRAGSDGDAMVGFWSDASATTCDFSDPHYKIAAKKVIVILNKRIILKSPQVYIEKRMVFQSPFDYVIPLSTGDKQKMIIPTITYHSDKGIGVGLAGPFVWASGQIDINAVYWTDNITEAEIGITQHIGRDLSLFASSSRLYNKDDKDTLWRPRWGIMYNNPRGWTARLLESQRELVEVEMRPGMDRRYNVWRSPELSFSSPWFKIAPEHFLKFGGGWGRYQDNLSTSKPVMERIVGEANIYGEPQIKGWSVMPFYNAGYHYLSYNEEDASQRVTDLTLGFRWNVGRLKLGTAYVRRWVSGESPLIWDNYLDREDIYQQIAYEFPGTREWEKWEISLRAGYDFVDNKLNEMVYSLSYNKHCLTWQLYVRDSRPKSEISVGLRFIINAFPDMALNLGEQIIYDPFARPVPDSDWNKR